MQYLTAFLTGGAICVLGQLLIDKTALTPARILTAFVVAGVALGALGLYQPLVAFAGEGAAVPIAGFGNLMAQGVRDGGKLNLSIRKINVTAPYKQIPEVLNIDVTNLQLGKAIKVGALSFEGLEIATSPEVVVCSVKATRASRSAAAAADAEQA